MIKQINVSLEEKDYNILKQKKGNMTWYNFIMLLSEYDNQNTEELNGEQSPDAFNSNKYNGGTKYGK